MKIIRTIIVAVALVAGMLSLTAAPSQARPAKSMGAVSKIIHGGSVHSQQKKLTVSVIGTYKYQRLVNGKVKNFWGVRVSAQHCTSKAPRHCWGQPVEGRLGVGHPMGKPLPGGHHKMDVARGLSIGGLDIKPWQWAKNAAQGVATTSSWIGKADEAIETKLIIPCMAGTGGGWAKTATQELGKEFAVLGGFMTKAERAADVAGPEGYVVAGFAGCAVSFTAAGGYQLWQLRHHLGIS